MCFEVMEADAYGSCARKTGIWICIRLSLGNNRKETGICMGIVVCNGGMRFGNHGFMENEQPVTTCSIFSV